MTNLELELQKEGFERKDLSKMKLKVLAELQDIIDIASIMGSTTPDQQNASTISMIRNVESNADYIMALCFTKNGQDLATSDLEDIPTKMICTTMLLEDLMEIFAESTEQVKEAPVGKQKRKPIQRQKKD